MPSLARTGSVCMLGHRISDLNGMYSPVNSSWDIGQRKSCNKYQKGCSQSLRERSSVNDCQSLWSGELLTLGMENSSSDKTDAEENACFGIFGIGSPTNHFQCSSSSAELSALKMRKSQT